MKKNSTRGFRSIVTLFILLFYFLFSNNLKAQNGEFVSYGNRYYDNPKTGIYRDSDKEFQIKISISQFSYRGEIIVKDISTDMVQTIEIVGKVREINSPENKVIGYYSAIIKFFSLKQEAEVFLIMNHDKSKIEGLAIVAGENQSETHYALTPIEETMSSTGTGFFVSNYGHIVTNYHVVKKSREILVGGLNNNTTQTIKAVLVDYNEDLDIALIKVQNINTYIPYEVSKYTSEQGVKVFTMGYPMITTMGSEIKVTDGIISSKTGYMNNPFYYQISAPIQPGNSGGPLFNMNGEVIGLITAKLTNGENVGYALKSQYILNFLYQNKIFQESKQLHLQSMSFTEKIKKIKSTIVYIYSVK